MIRGWPRKAANGLHPSGKSGRLMLALQIAGSVLLLACIALYLSIFRKALIDDAFITFQYARNLTERGEWAFLPGQKSNTATSALNVLLTALVFRVCGAAPESALALATAEYAFLLAALVALSTKLFSNCGFAVLAFAAFLFNPLLVSTLGLESLLFTVLFIAALWAQAAKRWAWLGATLGFLTLTRPDGALLFLLCLAMAPGWRPKAEVVGAYALIMTPWLVFSWMSFGTPVPDTLFIKRMESSWAQWSFWNGLKMYALVYPAPVLTSFAFVAASIFLLGRHRPRLGGAGATCALFLPLYYIAYASLKAPPYHWYYVPLLDAGTVLGAMGGARAWGRLKEAMRAVRGARGTQATAPGRARWALAGCAAQAGLAAALALTPAVGLGWTALRDGALPIREMPIHTNWASTQAYEELAEWLLQRTSEESRILTHVEIGALAFYSQRRLINEFSDRGRLMSLLDRSTARGSWKWRLQRWQFRRVEVPRQPIVFTHYLTVMSDPPAGSVLVGRRRIASKWPPVERTVELWAPASSAAQ